MSTTVYTPAYDSGMSSKSSPSLIETLPLELLQKIFFLSQNCDLPLASRALLSTLDSASTKWHMAICMLSSNDVSIQALILRRRFMDLALFDSVARELAVPCAPHPKDPRRCSNNYATDCDLQEAPHFRLPNNLLLIDPKLCDRLMRGLRVEPHRDANGNEEYNIISSYKKDRHNQRCTKNLPTTQADDVTPANEIFWKIKLMKRLIHGGVHFDKHPTYCQQASAMIITSHKGLHEAVEAHNVDAVAFFLGSFKRNGHFTCDLYRPFRPNIKTLTTAALTCRNDRKDILYLLFRLPRVPEASRNLGVLLRWLRDRRASDKDDRKNISLEKTKSEADGYWVGDWMHYLINLRQDRGPGQQILTYEEFVANRR